MDRMLVVVFSDENKAFQGKTALTQLQDQGNINVVRIRGRRGECGPHRNYQAGG